MGLHIGYKCKCQHNLEIWNPVHWSMDDYPRFLALARELAQLIVLIYLYLFLKGNS